MRSLATLVLFFLALTFNLPAAETPPPLLAEVQHSPEQPRSGDTVTITVTAKAPVSSLTLEYQIVEPGKYIALEDPAFRLGWHSVRMENFHSATRFSAQIPRSAQWHRRLIRYRFKGADAAATPFLFPPFPPADSDTNPNFAYFVYDGTPAWKAAIEPKSRNRSRAQVMEFSPAVMSQVHNYILISKTQDVENATWREQAMDKEYRYGGTLVAHGRVYDHIRFRARGGEWRYAMGKKHVEV